MIQERANQGAKHKSSISTQLHFMIFCLSFKTDLENVTEFFQACCNFLPLEVDEDIYLWLF